MLLKSFILLSCIVLLAHGHSIQGRKLSVRTKRQHCSCVIISVQNQQLQCSCDSNQKNPNGQTALLPQQQRIDQQELQQELTQMQATPNAQCGCVLIVIQNHAQGTQSPQYQCQCTTSNGISNNNVNNNNFGNGQQFPTTYSPTLMTTTSTTTTTPALSTSSNHNKNRQQNPCQCVMISVQHEGPQSHYQCNCDKHSNPEHSSNDQPKEAVSGNYNNDQFGSGYQQQSHTTSGNVNGHIQAYHTTYVQNDHGNSQTAFESNGNGFSNGEYHSNQDAFSSIDSAFASENGNSYQASAETQDAVHNSKQAALSAPDLPPTTACIIIRLPANSKACVCQDDYVQCAENTCCLSSRYRSMKGNSKPEGGDSAVDLIMDVLKSIKTNLQKP